MEMKRHQAAVNGQEAHDLLVEVAEQVGGNPIPLLLMTTILAYFYSSTTWADISKIGAEEYRKIVTKVAEDTSFVVANAMEEALQPYKRVPSAGAPGGN